jgi:hypothetical protein
MIIKYSVLKERIMGNMVRGFKMFEFKGNLINDTVLFFILISIVFFDRMETHLTLID